MMLSYSIVQYQWMVYIYCKVEIVVNTNEKLAASFFRSITLKLGNYYLYDSDRARCVMVMWSWAREKEIIQQQQLATPHLI